MAKLLDRSAGFPAAQDVPFGCLLKFDGDVGSAIDPGLPKPLYRGCRKGQPQQGIRLFFMRTSFCTIGRPSASGSFPSNTRPSRCTFLAPRPRWRDYRRSCPDRRARRMAARDQFCRPGAVPERSRIGTRWAQRCSTAWHLGPLRGAGRTQPGFLCRPRIRPIPLSVTLRRRRR